MTTIRTFNLKLSMDNEDFGDEPGYKLARILRQAATRLERCPSGSAYEPAKAREGYNFLLDANGNSVGWYCFGRARAP